MRLAIFIQVAIGLAMFFPDLAIAQNVNTDVEADLRACYDRADTPDGKYDCLGSSAQTCMRETDQVSDQRVLSCVRAEGLAWRGLLATETAALGDTIRLSEDSDDACEPSIAQCLEQVEQMSADAVAQMNIKCDIESQPENAAGQPQLALALCEMRETARSTIWMNALRLEVTP